MYAITLWQPWAQLIADGVKRYETRSWKPPRHLIGKRIAIHAAKRKVREQDLPNEVAWRIYIGYGPRWHERIPYGAIVATAMLVDVFHIKEVQPDCLKVEVLSRPGLHTSISIDPLGDYSPGRYVWSLIDIKRLDSPVEVKGMQRLWKTDAISAGGFTKQGLAMMRELEEAYPPGHMRDRLVYGKWVAAPGEEETES